jgi:Arc/MetJ family transcription regulator
MRIQERSRRGLSLALLLILPFSLASFAAKCDKKGNNNNAVVNGRQTDTALDDMLRDAIRQRITDESNNANNNTGLRALGLHVNVTNLKATLKGKVKTDAARDLAIRIAGETEVEKDGRTFKAAQVEAGELTVDPNAP